MWFDSLIQTIESAIHVAIIVVGTYAGSLLGGPEGAVIAAGASAVVVEVLPAFNDDPNATEIDANMCTTKECFDAAVAQHHNKQMRILWETYGSYAIFGGLGTFLLIYFFGWLTPNFKQMRYKKERNKAMGKLFDDPNMKMKDL